MLVIVYCAAALAVGAIAGYFIGLNRNRAAAKAEIAALEEKASAQLKLALIVLKKRLGIK